MGGHEGPGRGLFRKENAVYWVFVAMFAVSTAAILIKLSHSHPLTKAFWRLLLAEFVLLPFFLARYKDDLRELSLGTLLGLVLVGLSLALHFALWIWSFEYTGVASSVLLVTVHPIFVASISAALFKERLRWMAVAGIAVAFGGTFLILLGDLLEEGFSFRGKQLLGNLLALGGALTAGIYLLAGSRFRKRLSLPTYAFIVYGSAACFLFLAIPFAKAQVLVEDPVEYLIFAGLALGPMLAGHTLYNWALKYVSPTLVSVSLLGEPIGSTILAIIVLGELPSWGAWVGGPIVLAGIYLVASSTRGKKETVT